MSLYASAGTCATLSHPCQPPPTLHIHFPFPLCSWCSIHVASLQLLMLQEASLNMCTHSRGVSGAARHSPSHQGNACPIPRSWGQSRRAWTRGGLLEEVGSGAIPALRSAADIDECANETLCGSHGFCENSDGSFRCLCDRGYESSPSGHYCVGESPVITLPVSEGEPSADARLVSPLCDSSQSTGRDCICTWRIPDMDRAARGGKNPPLSTADP